MTNFIVTADIHTQIRKDVPEQWQVDRYQLLFNTLIEHCVEYEAGLIIAGDLFEKAKPTLQELKQVLEFLRKLKALKIPVYIVSGNHEKLADGVDTFQYLDMGSDKTIDVFYKPGIHNVNVEKEGYNLVFMNHCNLTTELPIYPFASNILISHFRCTVNQFIQEEIDVAELLVPFDLCIAGDIHLPMTQGKLMYPGCPMNKEFEKTVNTGFMLLTLDEGTVKTKRISTNLPALVSIECEATEQPEDLDPRHFYQIKIKGTPAELRDLVRTPNVKYVPIPVIEDVCIQKVAEEDVYKELPLEAGLIGYMQELEYTETYITDMVTVFREA